MNYQYNYKNVYKNKRRSERTIVIKMARQLSIVLCLMLVVVMFKYVKTGVSESVNGKIVDILNLDYTSKINGLLTGEFGNFSEKIDDILGKMQVKKEFKLAFLPIEDKITSGFGMRKHPITNKNEMHNGIDITAKEGSNVKLVYTGTVEKIQNDKGLGLTVTINHNNGYSTVYGHLSQVEVIEGEDITAGSVIAKSGNTGVSTGPHIHFEVHKGNKPVDPMDLISK